MQSVRVKNDAARPSESTIRDKAARWLGIEIDTLKQIDVYLLDLSLSEAEIDSVQEEILVDPVTEASFYSYSGAEKKLLEGFDWLIQVGLKPGMKDGEGERAKEAIEDLLGKDFEGGVYTAREFLVEGELSRSEVGSLANELLANELVNRITIIPVGTGEEITAQLDEIPAISGTKDVSVRTFSLEEISEVSDLRNLALSEEDIIGRVFLRPWPPTAAAQVTTPDY